MISNYRSKIIAFLLSIRLETTPLAMITVYTGGLIAGSLFLSLPLLLAVIVSFFITAGSMTFNDTFDWKIDMTNHPNRPIPKGILNPRQLLYFTGVLFSIGIFISFFINLLCFVIVILSIVFLAMYELFTKTYGITGNVTVAFISSIAFTFGGAAVGNPFASLPFTILAFLIILGREIIMDVRDADGDKKFRRTLPNQIGLRNATIVSGSILILAIFISPLPYLLNIVSIWYLFFIIPVDIITLATIFLVVRDQTNAAISAHIIRVMLVIGLIGFIFGILI